MTTIASYISNIDAVKNAIAASITNKGVSMTGVAFTGYAGKIDEISGSSEVTFGSQKTCTFNYTGCFQSTLLGTPVLLGSAKPASPNFSYTIASGMFPAVSGDSLAEYSGLGCILWGWRNYSTSARGLNYQIDLTRGGITTTITSGLTSNISANAYGAVDARVLSVINNADPQIGDIIDVYLWCEAEADVISFTKYGLRIAPSRIKPVNQQNKLINNVAVTVALVSISNFLHGPNPEGAMYLFGNNVLYFYSSFTLSSPVVEDDEYGLCIVHGDSATGQIITKSNATSNVVVRFYVPASVTWEDQL